MSASPRPGSPRRPKDPAPVKASGAPRHVGAKLLLLALCCYFLIPVWWVVVASTKNAEGLFAGTGALWFHGFHLFDNLHDLFTFNNGEYLRWLGNSALYAFNLAFQYAQFNYASAISFSLGFVVFLAVAIFMVLTRKRGSLLT